jgi:hypothetical protein
LENKERGEIHMETVPANCPAFKGAIPECLDAMSRRSDARDLMKNLQGGIEALREKGFENLANAFARHMFAPIYQQTKRSRAISGYLRKCWFDESSEFAYFPALQPIAPVYAEGILTTLRLSLRAKGNPTPIDAWWVIDHQSFEMINLVSKQQITLIIATPRPGLIKKARPGLGETEVWTTKLSKPENIQFIRKPE